VKFCRKERRVAKEKKSLCKKQGNIYREKQMCDSGKIEGKDDVEYNTDAGDKMGQSYCPV
jgi:hypothetical protein